MGLLPYGLREELIVVFKNHRYLLLFSDHLDITVESWLGDGELVADFLYRESFCLIQMPGGKGSLVCLFR